MPPSLARACIVTTRAAPSTPAIRASECASATASHAWRLFIAAGIDKEEYEPTLPLTPRLAELFARRAAALPGGEGLLFGEYQSALRTFWYDAAKAAGIDERRARKISVYDFRHAAAKRFLDATGNVRGTAFMLGHRNATGSTHRYTKLDKPAADRLVDALGLARPDASASPAPAAALVVAPPSPPASPGDSLDVPQPSDYASVPPREGGGIGRRTSLRCFEGTAAAKEGPPGVPASVEGCLAYALVLAAQAGRWDIVGQLGRAMEAFRSR